MSIKVLLLGEASVGKTCIVSRLASDFYNPSSAPTVGAENARVMVSDADDNSVEFNIWDTAGQERYRSLTPMYFSGAVLAVLVFDITKPASFAVIEDFVKLLRTRAPENIALVLVGNKSDLENERQVTLEDAEKLANRIDAAFYMETSAMNSSNIKELFQACAGLDVVRNAATGEEVIPRVRKVEPDASKCKC